MTKFEEAKILDSSDTYLEDRNGSVTDQDETLTNLPNIDKNFEINKKIIKRIYKIVWDIRK